MVEGFRLEPVPELATQGGRRGIGVSVPVIPEFGRIHKAIFRVGDGRAHVKVQAFEQEIVLFQFVGEQGGPRSSMSLPDIGFYALDFLVGLALAQTPEELYDLYSTPETRAILEKANQIEQESQDAEAATRTKKTLALSLAIVIGLIPLGYIGRNITTTQGNMILSAGKKYVVKLHLGLTSVKFDADVENRITRQILLDNGDPLSLEAGKKYVVKLHLGLTSVKFNASVSEWSNN